MFKNPFSGGHWYERLYAVLSIIVLPLYFIILYSHEGADLIPIIIGFEILLLIAYRAILYIVKGESFFKSETLQINTIKKRVAVRTFKAVSYTVLFLLSFLTWGILKNDFEVGGIVPMAINFGIFFLLALAITKIKTPGTPPGEEGIKEEKQFLKTVLLSVFCIILALLTVGIILVFTTS